MSSVFECHTEIETECVHDESYGTFREPLVYRSQRLSTQTLREKLALLERRLNPRPWDARTAQSEALLVNKKPRFCVEGFERLSGNYSGEELVTAGAGAPADSAAKLATPEAETWVYCAKAAADGCGSSVCRPGQSDSKSGSETRRTPIPRGERVPGKVDVVAAATMTSGAAECADASSVDASGKHTDQLHPGQSSSCTDNRFQAEIHDRTPEHRNENDLRCPESCHRRGCEAGATPPPGSQSTSPGNSCSVAETILTVSRFEGRSGCQTELGSQTPSQTTAATVDRSSSPVASNSGERSCRSEPARHAQEWTTPAAVAGQSTMNRPRKRKARVPAAEENNGLTLDQFFSRAEKMTPSASAGACTFEMDSIESGSSRVSAADDAPGSQSIAGQQDARLVKATASVEEIHNQYVLQIEGLSTQLEELRAVAFELESTQERLSQVERAAGALRNALMDALREQGRLERGLNARLVAEKCQRLGQPVIARSGTALQEVWEDGSEFQRLSERQNVIAAERESIERSRKELSRLRRPAPGQNDATADAPQWLSMYIAEQEEIFRVRIQLLKRDEAALAEERAKLECERAMLLRELKRVRDESASRFREFPLLADRYLLLRLLGRGGFSEVWKAYDIEQARYVACKIHQLHAYWSESRKSNYIKHATREYRIHATLKHPRIVSLYDVFEIDDHTFCTVLEYCGEACDLDTYLRMNHHVSEREAKSIIAQVLSALLYLNSQPKRIIHYDLKPGNILYTNGEVRITDFGLSKIMDENLNTMDGMELTSQGAGTYWYLPPECFEGISATSGATGPRISNKVDVWSCGIILYQLLYGVKPFGNDLSQERILRDGTILKASDRDLFFPAKPAVSTEAKDFIRLCLTRNQMDRPDIRSIAMHHYLRGTITMS